ncbi:MAG: restriction endonuclease subunit S [Chitinophagales bacterium]|nr:restriction endonuclease subunit S [Chitinophagales bacterium]
MSIERTNKIPKGWTKAKLSDIAHFINGKAFKSQDWRNKGIPIIRIQNLNNPGAFYNYISETQFVEPQYKITKGDLLFAWSGTPGTSFGAHIWDGKEAYLNQHIFKVITFSGIDKMFLFYALNYLVIDFVIKSKGTAGLSHITKKDFEATSLIIPPLPEQKRIVNKVEELFSELDEAEKNLNTVQKKLTLYVNVVLKDAFQGKFTLADNEISNSASKKLVQNITLLKENLYRTLVDDWTKKLKKWNNSTSKSKKPTKPSLPKLIPSLTKKEIEELPNIPNTWAWIKINDITLGVSYGSSTKSEKKGKVPVLRMGNIQNHFFQWQDLVYTSNKAEITKYKLKRNDVLFNRTNSPELVGKSAIFKGEQDAIFAGYLIRINQIDSIINGDYLNYYLNSPIARSYGNKVKTDAVNQSNINGDKLIGYPIPICSLSEQEKVVREIEYRLTISENLKETTKQNLNKAQVFRHKILSLAMNGNISSQNNADEPASLLLPQIQKEKEKYLIEQKELYMSITKKRQNSKQKFSILEILKAANKPVSAKDVWLQSVHSNDIEEFYAELKSLKNQVFEIKKDTESLLTLTYENR